jgi:hypothetical protein
MRTVVITLTLGLLAAQPPLKTIQEIQTPIDLAANNDTSVLHGQVVRVRGVVVTECDWHRHFNVSGGLIATDVVSGSKNKVRAAPAPASKSADKIPPTNPPASPSSDKANT